MGGDLAVHLGDQVDQVTQHLEHVHRFRAQPGLRGDAAAGTFDALLQLATHRQVQFLAHDLVEVAAAGQVQVIQRGQACGSARQQLERAKRLDLLDAPD